ncbi:MAG: hypothetical protein ABIR33_13035 [Pyrinomonadaceae bacterium]
MRIFLLTTILLGLPAISYAQCPTIKVRGPAGITNSGDEMTFEAELNVIGPKLSYSWSVDKGTIIEGQGTREISIATDGIAGETITATVEVEGLPNDCKSSASETAGVAPAIEDMYPDSWGVLKPNDERGRLDLFFADLSNSPADAGWIILTVKPGDRLDPTNPRIHFILKHAKYRKFDKGRIVFAIEVGDERLTTVWRVLPRAAPPTCSGCTIFRGENL